MDDLAFWNYIALLHLINKKEMGGIPATQLFLQIEFLYFIALTEKE